MRAKSKMPQSTSKTKNSEFLRDALRRTMSAWSKLERTFSQVAGGADYQAYLQHFYDNHKDKPNAKPLSPEEFYQMINDESGKRPRCCQSAQAAVSSDNLRFVEFMEFQMLGLKIFIRNSRIPYIFLWLCAIPVFADGWVRLEKDGFTSRLENFSYRYFIATGELKDSLCKVYIDGILNISGVNKKSNIKLDIFGLNLKVEGKFDKNKNLRLNLSNGVTIASHQDVSDNTQIIISDGTKMIIRKDAKQNLYINSNAAPMYELAIICAYLAKQQDLY